jgi:small GTP-binding protein
LQPTVGVDFLGKNIKYKGNIYRIELWDTAGQEKYRSLVKGYLKGADACVFVYDCTSKYL